MSPFLLFDAFKNSLLSSARQRAKMMLFLAIMVNDYEVEGSKGVVFFCFVLFVCFKPGKG